jgi:hypothetical protein
MQMAEIVSGRMLAREDLESLIGAGNSDMMCDNHRNHARFMNSLFKMYTPEMLAETILWVFRAYRAHGFRLTYWPAQLDTWVLVMKDQLSAVSLEEIYPYYAWMLINQASFAELSEEGVSKDN